MTTYWLFLLCFVVTFQCCKNEEHLLGKSIYVPTEDLLGSIPNGITFFTEISDACYRKVEHRTLVKEQSFYQNTGHFFKSVATLTGLKAQQETVFSLGVTLDVTTKHVSGDSRSVAGTSLNIATKNLDVQLSPNCLYETALQGRVLEDFASLPTEIPSPWYRDSWVDYERFLETHGSHVITVVTHGSSIDQYAFAKQSSSYTEKQFTAKVCAALPGEAIGALGLSLSACGGVTKEDVENITNADIKTTLTIRGGSLEMRSKLLYYQTPQDILKFLSEGNTTSLSPITYKLTPIWKILRGHAQVKQSNPDANIQATNMQYLFDGYLNFGCEYIPAGERGPIIQMFNYAERSSSLRPVFQCSLAPEGCHNRKDCHYRIFKGCVCFGKSCIRHKFVQQSTGFSKQTAVLYTKNDWANEGSCSWKTKGISCHCKHEKLIRRVIF